MTKKTRGLKVEVPCESRLVITDTNRVLIILGGSSESDNPLVCADLDGSLHEVFDEDAVYLLHLKDITISGLETVMTDVKEATSVIGPLDIYGSNSIDFDEIFSSLKKWAEWKERSDERC